jgi:hypothetical protein
MTPIALPFELNGTLSIERRPSSRATSRCLKRPSRGRSVLLMGAP